MVVNGRIVWDKFERGLLHDEIRSAEIQRCGAFAVEIKRRAG